MAPRPRDSDGESFYRDQRARWEEEQGPLSKPTPNSIKVQDPLPPAQVLGASELESIQHKPKDSHTGLTTNDRGGVGQGLNDKQDSTSSDVEQLNIKNDRTQGRTHYSGDQGNTMLPAPSGHRQTVTTSSDTMNVSDSDYNDQDRTQRAVVDPKYRRVTDSSRVIVESPSGRRVQYMSREEQAAFSRRLQQQTPEERIKARRIREEKVAAYQRNMSGGEPYELTAQNVKALNSKGDSSRRKSGVYTTPKAGRSDGIQIRSGDTTLHVYGDAKIEIRPNEADESKRIVLKPSRDPSSSAKEREPTSMPHEAWSGKDAMKDMSAQPAQVEDYDSDEGCVVSETKVQALHTGRRFRPPQRRDAASDSGYSSNSAPWDSTSSKLPAHPPAVTPVQRGRPVIHQMNSASRECPNGDPTCRDPDCLAKRNQERRLSFYETPATQQPSPQQNYASQYPSAPQRQNFHISAAQAMPPPALPRSGPTVARPRPLSMHAGYGYDSTRPGPPPSASAYYGYYPGRGQAQQYLETMPPSQVTKYPQESLVPQSLNSPTATTYPNVPGNTGSFSARQTNPNIPGLESAKPATPVLRRTVSARRPTDRPTVPGKFPEAEWSESESDSSSSGYFESDEEHLSYRRRRRFYQDQPRRPSVARKYSTEPSIPSNPESSRVPPRGPSVDRRYIADPVVSRRRSFPIEEPLPPTELILNNVQVSRGFEEHSQLSAARPFDTEDLAPASLSRNNIAIDDSDDDSVFAESIFSQASLASSATTASDASISEDLIRDFVTILFCTEDLRDISASAVNDSAVGSQRYQRNIRRLIAQFGRSLKRESLDDDQAGAARLLQSRNISARAARDIVHQAEQSNDTLAVKIMTASAHINVATAIEKHGEEDLVQETSTVSLDDGLGADDDDHSEISVDDQEDFYAERFDVRALQKFLLESTAYSKFREQLVEFVHRSYEGRILRAMGGQVISADGKRNLGRESIKAVAKDISWVPVRFVRFSEHERRDVGDYIKGWVEDKLEETWNWWPLQQVNRPIAPGCSRVYWVSPVGAPRHVEIPFKAARALHEALDSAPAFVNSHSNGIPAQKFPNQSPSGNTGASVQSPSSGRSSGSGKQPCNAQQHGYGSLGCACAPSPNGQVSQALQTTEPRHVFLCVKRGSSHKFSDMETHTMRCDAHFFAALKENYFRLRGRVRRYFSMWQYDRCDFFQFQKFDIDKGTPYKEAFPPSSNAEYDFLPRPIDPSPPGGPISDQEFRERFYKSCHQCHSWHLHHREKIRNTSTVQHVAKDAIALLPKRKEALHMDDGRREQFWGIYARERRCFAWVLAYGLLFNLPGVIFFFLWLFQWKHASDLQNAAVPVGMSVSLTMLFVALLFESREKDRT